MQFNQSDTTTLKVGDKVAVHAKALGVSMYMSNNLQEGKLYTVKLIKDANIQPYLFFKGMANIAFYACYFKRSKISNEERMQRRMEELHDERGI